MINKLLAMSTLISDMTRDSAKDAPEKSLKILETDEITDGASVLVLILQGETKTRDANIKELRWAFSDPYFTVQVCSLEEPKIIPKLKTLTKEQFIENHRMRRLLTYAAEGPYIEKENGSMIAQKLWMNKSVIIIKDSSVSHITPTFNHDEIGGMKKRIKRSLEAAKSADLFFLCKWGDACEKFVDINKVEKGTDLKWSVQPTSTQAIMYTPKAREYVREILTGSPTPLGEMLNDHIRNTKLSATVFVPNIIDFDVNLATSKSDYAKLNECSDVATSTNSTTMNNPSLIWFVIVFIVAIVLLMWLVVQFMPRR